MAAPEALDTFRDHVRQVLTCKLEHYYPDYVAEVRRRAQAGDPAAKDVELPTGAHQRLTSIRSVLTRTLEVELWIRQLRHTHRLLAAVPDNASLERLSLNQGDWHFLTLQNWVLTVDGLFDRSKKLISLAFRTIRKPYDPSGYVAEERRLIGSIKALQARINDPRNSIAHGGGQIFESLADNNAFEVQCVLNVLPDIENLMMPMLDNRVARTENLQRASVQTLAQLNAIFGDLDQSIDWSRFADM
jgi:hypothetical protein